MTELVVFAVALFALGVTPASLLLAGGARLAEARLERLQPRARARAYLSLSALPVLVGGLVACAVLIPQTWLGQIDHCSADAAHLHLCTDCGLPSPPLAVWLVAIGFALFAGARLTAEARGLVRALRALRGLTRGSRPVGDVRVIESSTPLAFTAGFLRPTVFVSPCAQRPEWSAVVAHERDHAAHRDPLARLVARLALALWVPPLGARILSRLSLAQELAADELAADQVGDRHEVARQVLAWVRAHVTPSVALAFEGGDLETRVQTLVDPPRYRPGPRSVHAILALALGAALAVAASHSIHHVVEELVDVLSS